MSVNPASSTQQSAIPTEALDGPNPSTRQRLLEVAAELFAERGYSGASLGEIASRLGIRKPSLYNHIASKDELFMELLERSLDAWQAASDSPLEGEGSHRQRLRRHLGKTVAFAVDCPHATALCRLAVSQVSGELAERASALLLRHRTDYQRLMERFFESALQAGEVASTEVPGTTSEVPGTTSEGTTSEVPGTTPDVTVMPEVLTFSWLTFLDGILMHQVFSLGSRRDAYLERLEDLWQLFWRGLVFAAEPLDE